MNIHQLNLARLHLEIKSEIDEAISKIFDASAFIGGKQVEEFEQSFSQLAGSQYCVSCANGTDALYIATKSLGIKPGDEVLVPAMSWVSTSEILSQSGARPIFVDIDPVSYCINPEKIIENITEKTVGIIPVHLYGHPADMGKIMKIATDYSLWVIEDCAQAHLAEFNGTKVGTFGDIGTFSFFPGKNLGAVGDAGALITGRNDLAEFAKKYSNHGQVNKHAHEFDGINSRMDGIQAAILNVKIKHIKRWTKARWELAQKYTAGIDEKNVLAKPLVKQGAKHAWHLYSLLVEEPDKFQDMLSKNGIASSRNYPQPLTRLKQYKFKSWEDANAMRLASHVVNIPMCPMLKDDEVHHILKVISNA